MTKLLAKWLDVQAFCKIDEEGRRKQAKNYNQHHCSDHYMTSHLDRKCGSLQNKL
jgi:hypothetical protein